jgi:hypothetical protein
MTNNKLTGEQILEKIQENMSVQEFAYEDYSPEELELGEVKVVDSYGGPDKGSTWYKVQYFVEHDVYIRTDGWYSSYDGTYFDEGYGSVVKPVEKMVTFYE